jgi:cellulose synthase/poly-beta-1,6-N-acetylglucosamine synthase-like glycosyltransferase
MSHFELFLLISYCLSGVVAWAVYGELLIAGRRKMLLMKRPPHPIQGEPPSVTILIPAKDEGERIRGCIESAIHQDYPRLDVIAIDDRSTDNTGTVMDEISAANPRLSVLHIKQPPAQGWTGKNNALYNGAKQATGDWLLFVDSDVILEKDALAAAMSVVLRKKFDLLSLLPRLESHSIWEEMLVPLAGSAASTMYLIALNNNSQLPNVAFANGQFMLMSRSAYDAIGRHETVRDRYCEDVEIARLMKTHGLRPRVSWGNDFCSVRMYSSLPSIIRGWSRIYYAARVGSPWRTLSALMFVLQCCFTVYPALAWGIWRTIHPGAALHGYMGIAWLTAAILHWVVMTWFLGVMYHWSGNRRRTALLFPVAGSLLVYIFLRALRMCVTKKVVWRGTAYQHTMQEIPVESGPSQQPAHSG